jgi:hypothetical protein
VPASTPSISTLTISPAIPVPDSVVPLSSPRIGVSTEGGAVVGVIVWVGVSVSVAVSVGDAVSIGIGVGVSVEVVVLVGVEVSVGG